MTQNYAVLQRALQRIADPRNIHFAGDAQVVATEALAALNPAPTTLVIVVKEQCKWSVGGPTAFFYVHLTCDGHPEQVIALPEAEAHALACAFPPKG